MSQSAASSETPSLSRVAEIVSAELGIPRDEVSPESSLTEDLGLDRWDLFELVERLEDVYAVTLPEAVIDHVDRVSELADALELATCAPSRSPRHERSR